METGSVAATDLLGLKGRPVLVMGGGRGIGEATSRLLGAAGAAVAVADVDGARAARVAEDLSGSGVPTVAVTGDATDPHAAQRMVDEAHRHLGGLCGVVNIVGLASWGDLLTVDVGTWESDLRINLLHHLLVGRAAARHMIDDGVCGAIAMVASVSGLYGAPGHGAYGAAKAGVVDLARTMAVEWGPKGIRVNVVSPDIIATPRVVAGFAERGVTELDTLAVDDGVPLGRWGTPAEIAGPLVFLLSDLATFITGQNLVVDGGTRAMFPHPGPKPFSDD